MQNALRSLGEQGWSHEDFLSLRHYHLCLFLIAAAALLSFCTGLTVDQSTLLQFSEHMVRGEGLYRVWAEVNPPLVFLIYAAPAYAVSHFHVSASVAVHALAFVLCAVSVFVLRRDAAAWPVASRQAWLVAAGAAFFVASAPNVVFGDRDFMLFVLIFPWLAARLTGRQSSLAAEMLAAVGFALKPYNYALFAVLVLFCGPAGETLRRKICGRGTLVVGGFAVLYAAIAWFAFPEYFTRILPLALRTYGVLAYPAGHRLWILARDLAPAVALLEAAGMPAGRRRSYGLLAGAAVTYFLNGGWGYTEYLLLVPIIAAFAVNLTVPVEEMAVARRERLEVARMLFTLGALLFTAYGFEVLGLDLAATRRFGMAWEPRDASGLQDLDERLAAVARPDFVFLSTTHWASQVAGPALTPRPLLGYDYLWPLPWLVTHPDDAHAAKVGDDLDHAVLAALRARPAPTLIVDDSVRQRGLPDRFSLLGFFVRDPAIQAALTFYRRDDVIDLCGGGETAECRYSVWRPAWDPASPRPASIEPAQ